MYEVLSFAKETENKIRWDCIANKAKFQLYIPKWRVPDPIPLAIYVRLYEVALAPPNIKTYSRQDIELKPFLRSENIFSHVKKSDDKTLTVRFDPIGNTQDWEIGNPYIPESILPSAEIEELIIEVQWR